MNRAPFYTIALIITVLNFFTFKIVVSQNDSKRSSINYKDSVFRSSDFISITEADKILGKPSRLLDSLHKVSSGLLRYKIEYVATYKDSSSKGRIFFMFEQYADASSLKSIYDNIKIENLKTSKLRELKDFAADEAFLAIDNFNYPFILVRKENKLFKFKLYYLDAKVSLDELLVVAKKIVAKH